MVGTLDFEQALVAVASGRTVWRLHALRRMIERGISRAEVIGAQKYKKVIEDYPDDTPYPSCLVLGFIEQRPLHVVVAYDATEQDAYIITVYVFSLDKFEPDWRTRREP